MKKSLKRRKASKPFAGILCADLGFPESVRIVQVQISRPKQPGTSMSPKKGKDADQQSGHAEEGGVHHRVVLPIQRIGMRFIQGETDCSPCMTLPAGVEDIGLGQT